MKIKTIAHVDMDAFFAAIEERDNPSLKGKPIIIGSDPKGGKGRGVVSTCSYEARKYGIHSAMPISKAYRLCPHGVFIKGSMRHYKETSLHIFSILNDFTPDVEPVSIDEAFLDLTGSFHLFGGPKQTCQKIKDRIKNELGLTASIGIASNKMVAKIASDLCKPDGLLQVEQEKLLDFLCPLPIEKIWGVGPKTKTALNRLGILTIGELARTPLETLVDMFGEHGAHLYNLANGIDKRDVELSDEVKSISNEYTFEVDANNKKKICDSLSFLCEKVSRRLRKSSLKGRTLTLKFRFDNFKTITRSITFSEGTDFFDDIFKKAKTMLDSIFEGNVKCRLIGVRMSNFKDSPIQLNFFDGILSEKKEKIHKALDLIKDKFGEKAIERGMSYSSHTREA